MSGSPRITERAKEPRDELQGRVLSRVAVIHAKHPHHMICSLRAIPLGFKGTLSLAYYVLGPMLNTEDTKMNVITTGPKIVV